MVVEPEYDVGPEVLMTCVPGVVLVAFIQQCASDELDPAIPQLEPFCWKAKARSAVVEAAAVKPNSAPFAATVKLKSGVPPTAGV